MVCPNCKHEINPLARVCPTCGTPVPGGPGAPTVVVTPPNQGGASAKTGKVTAARVFAIIFCLLAIVANAALIASWFFPLIQMTGKGPDSASLASLHGLYSGFAPYLTFIVIAACVISIIFCLFPMFKKHANRRRRLLIPKLMAIVCAGCYLAPWVVPSLSIGFEAALKGEAIIGPFYTNPFPIICLGLFILLCAAAELTTCNRRLIQEQQTELLRAQLTSYGIKPNC